MLKRIKAAQIQAGDKLVRRNGSKVVWTSPAVAEVVVKPHPETLKGKKGYFKLVYLRYEGSKKFESPVAHINSYTVERN